MHARIREIDLAYDDRGQGPTLVFLHGYPFNRAMWQGQIEFFSARGFRCVAPDLRGLGESSDKLQAAESRPLKRETARQAEAHQTITTMQEMARDAALLMDALKIERAAICGLSMGSYVALEFIRLFGSRADALILAGARAQAADEDEQRSRQQQAEQALKNGITPVADVMLPKLFARRTLAEKPDVVARVREMILGTSPAGAAAAQRGMAARRDHSPFLSAITIPTLIIAGAEDSIRSPEDAEFLHEQISGSRLETIKEAGHLMNIEQPQIFNNIVLDFLKR
jgi:pimeloyl-ACP methyl ester carboxylesterase